MVEFYVILAVIKLNNSYTLLEMKDAEILHSKVGNYNNPEYPELEDYGDATLSW